MHLEHGDLRAQVHLESNSSQICFYNSSRKGVCPKSPVAAIDFFPLMNFFAAWKQISQVGMRKYSLQQSWC